MMAVASPTAPTGSTRPDALFGPSSVSCRQVIFMSGLREQTLSVADKIQMFNTQGFRVKCNAIGASPSSLHMTLRHPGSNMHDR